MLFLSSLRWRNKLKMQQSPVILDLSLRKTRSGKWQDFRDAIVYEKLRFQNVFRPNESETRSFQVPSVWRAFWQLRFRDRFFVDGRPSRRNKIAFSTCFGIVWAGSDRISTKCDNSECDEYQGLNEHVSTQESNHNVAVSRETCLMFTYRQPLEVLSAMV